jgi:hypothetical protein
MRDSSVVPGVRLAPIALILINFTVAMLVVASIVEVWEIIGDVVGTIRNVNGIFLAVALAAALLPAWAVIFWGGKAIVVQLAPSFRWMRQFFRQPGDRKGGMRSDG